MENKKIINEYCTVLASVDELEHREWLELRKIGFGGSDAGGIMKLSKFNTPYTVVNSKLQSIRMIDNVHTRFGNRMEGVIRQWYQDDHKEVEVFESRYVYQNNMFPFMMANIDGVIAVNNQLKGMEIKTVSEFLKSQWIDGNIPDDYYCQCQHYMAVMGFQEWEIVGLIGKDIISYTIPRNDEFINDLITAEKYLWEEYVLKKQYPMLLGLECEGSIVDENHKNPTEDVIILEQDINDYAVRYHEIGQEEKKLKDEKKRLNILIKDAVGDHKKGTTENFNISYIRSNKKGFNHKALKEERPDIYSDYETETFSTSIRVTPNKVYKELAV